jgi:hypothetical protein
MGACASKRSIPQELKEAEEKYDVLASKTSGNNG